MSCFAAMTDGSHVSCVEALGDLNFFFLRMDVYIGIKSATVEGMSERSGR